MNKLVLKFLWLEKSIAVCLDQKIGSRTTPLTEYYFWPQKDAWEEMKNFLENKSWINENDSILLLNRITEVINCWQEKDPVNKVDFNKLRDSFPDCLFLGHDQYIQLISQIGFEPTHTDLEGQCPSLRRL